MTLFISYYLNGCYLNDGIKKNILLKNKSSVLQKYKISLKINYQNIFLIVALFISAYYIIILHFS